jgi:uncharacterized protein (DUF488 family)
MTMTIWTIGHSTRTSDEFLAVILAHEIEAVVDVRRMPGSRRMPQFNSDALSTSLASRGVAYQWIPALGGRRRPNPDSPNTGWRHSAFRAYADYTASEEFADGLFELVIIAEGLRTAIMCAEVLWWRCHRRIVADVLTSIGERVEHIQDSGPAELHKLAAPARMVKGVLTYVPA